MMKISKYFFVSFIFTYLYLPLIYLIINSFNSNRYGYKWGDFSLKWYYSLFMNTELTTALFHSLFLAFCSATLALVIGVLIAHALNRYHFRYKSLSSSLIFICIMSPDIILAIAFLILFIALDIELGFYSLLIAHTTFCIPFVVIIVYASLQKLSVDVIDVARDLGATESHVFLRIILPQIRNAIISGWLLSFTLSLDDVIISSFVNGSEYEILPIKVFSMVKIGVSPEINVIATILLFLLLMISGIALLLTRKK